MRTSRWVIRNRAKDSEYDAVPFALCKRVCLGGGNSHISQSEGVEVSFCEKPIPKQAYLYFLSLSLFHMYICILCACLCVYMSKDAQICRYMCINVYDERWPAPSVFYQRPSTLFPEAESLMEDGVSNFSWSRFAWGFLSVASSGWDCR